MESAWTGEERSSQNRGICRRSSSGARELSASAASAQPARTIGADQRAPALSRRGPGRGQGGERPRRSEKHRGRKEAPSQQQIAQKLRANLIRQAEHRKTAAPAPRRGPRRSLPASAAQPPGRRPRRRCGQDSGESRPGGGRRRGQAEPQNRGGGLPLGEVNRNQRKLQPRRRRRKNVRRRSAQRCRRPEDKKQRGKTRIPQELRRESNVKPRRSRNRQSVETGRRAARRGGLSDRTRPESRCPCRKSERGQEELFDERPAGPLHRFGKHGGGRLERIENSSQNQRRQHKQREETVPQQAQEDSQAVAE